MTSPETPTVVFRARRALTMGAEEPEAFAVEGERVVAAGLLGEDPLTVEPGRLGSIPIREVDLGGRRVWPQEQP